MEFSCPPSDVDAVITHTCRLETQRKKSFAHDPIARKWQSWDLNVVRIV